MTYCAKLLSLRDLNKMVREELQDNDDFATTGKAIWVKIHNA